MTSLVDNASILPSERPEVFVPVLAECFHADQLRPDPDHILLFVGLDGLPFSIKFLSLLYPIICLII